MRQPYKEQTATSCYINQTLFFGLAVPLCSHRGCPTSSLWQISQSCPDSPPCIPRHWHVGMSARCRPLAGAVASPAFTHSVGAYVENPCKRQSQTSALQVTMLLCFVCLIVSDPFFTFELQKLQRKRSHLQRRS